MMNETDSEKYKIQPWNDEPQQIPSDLFPKATHSSSFFNNKLRHNNFLHKNKPWISSTVIIHNNNPLTYTPSYTHGFNFYQNTAQIFCNSVLHHNTKAIKTSQCFHNYTLPKFKKQRQSQKPKKVQLQIQIGVKSNAIFSSTKKLNRKESFVGKKESSSRRFTEPINEVKQDLLIERKIFLMKGGSRNYFIGKS